MTNPKHHPLSDLGEVVRPRYLGELVKPTSGESYDWHSHDFGQLISAASGSMYVGTPGRLLLLSPAMVLWIPPDVEHWMQYGSNNQMLYVDVRKGEAEMIGEDCRIMAMTPLLNALMAGTMPDSAAGTTTLSATWRFVLPSAYAPWRRLFGTECMASSAIVSPGLLICSANCVT